MFYRDEEQKYSELLRGGGRRYCRPTLYPPLVAIGVPCAIFTARWGCRIESLKNHLQNSKILKLDLLSSVSFSVICCCVGVRVDVWPGEQAPGLRHGAGRRLLDSISLRLTSFCLVVANKIHWIHLELSFHPIRSLKVPCNLRTNCQI